MSVGGFTGSDPAPTLAQFQARVAQERVHWFVEGGLVGAAARAGAPHPLPAAVQEDPRFAEFAEMAQDGELPGGQGGSGSEISTWVRENFTSTTVGGRTVYDLTEPTT